jgi:uncharacterized protein YegP (UPF0339 family)
MRIAASLLTTLVLSLSSFAGCATSGDDGYGATDDESAGAGKLTFWQATDGQFHFNLKSGNGAVLLTSEAYTSRTGAINGALSVLDNGVDTAQYKIVAATKGFVVHLVAGNNETISFSEVYATKSSATRAVGSCVRAVTSYLDKREANTTGARVEVTQGDSGQFHFNFFANNGQIVASSESYTTEAAAFNGAFAVQTDGQSALNYTIKQSASGSFFFVVTSPVNGQVTGVSQQYTTKASAQDGATALQKLLPTITVL